MVERETTVVRTIAWLEVFPWLSILRVFRVAIAVRMLVLATVGLLLTVVGWAVIGAIFNTDSRGTEWLESFTACPWLAVTSPVPDQPLLSTTASSWAESADWAELQQPANAPSMPWMLLTRPAWEGLADTALSMRAAATLLLCGLWGVAVWAFFGAAICRIAAVQLAADEQVGLAASVRYAVRKWPSYFAAPLMPVGGVLLAALPVLVLGWIMRAQVGLLLAGLVWPLAIAAGFFMALLLLGLLFGWPLMWATISAEGTDSFDALSRTYAYVFQRPLHYIFYAVVAGFIGWLGWLLARDFAAGVVWMTYWAAGWGNAAGVDAVRGLGDELSGVGYAGAWLIRFWTGCVKLLAVGYLFSYFWSAATAIYFLLRRDVDAAELDEVYLDADQSEPSAELSSTAEQTAAPQADENNQAQ